jgi:S-DNA-T family DNA segregation ATPase FtsK/SpoIIIE
MKTSAQTLGSAAPWNGAGAALRGRLLRVWDRATAALLSLLRLLGRWGLGIALIILGLGLVAALLSYSPADPSFNTATDASPANLAGRSGALVADLGLQAFGLAAAIPVPLLLFWGVRLLLGTPVVRRRRAVLLTCLAVPLSAAALGLAWPAPLGPIASGAGGAVGLLAAQAVASVPWPAAVDPPLAALLLALLVGLCGLATLVLALDVRRAEAVSLFRLARRPAEKAADEDAPPPRPRPRRTLEGAEDAAPDVAPEPTVRRIRGPAAAPPPRRAEQAALALGDRADLPALSLLRPAPPPSGQKLDAAALEANARLLESVLEDFGVRGRIVGLSQGPVVTLYELEPAPGIKASRVIGLADDIARSMSAVSVRVAVIPGRNVIGIELPNRKREMVVLSELISSPAFADSPATLPIVLGKDIAGHPVVADLAPMPHLLIAGTTGSGKSVGLNAMILSLLYRLRPDQCRMILIDPKMLELSVYDDIPHLLAPVVTEPSKAIRALKWAVEQMEERYRKMAHINVRSLAGYNERVRDAIRRGQSFTKKVQTGWDDEGLPVHEEVTLPLEPLPLIVIVVDELADLMMTAGKEVEFLIQRLAQKARAAGIHLIMATQRPSVDVITGVIKANLPTRISFQVTSKIDSRTILGEQGAEQLLGKGDMLYMPGGKQISRIHGPFVSDEEVESVADHWRDQGMPDYVESVTEEPPEGDAGFFAMPGAAGGKGNPAAAGDDTLAQAIQVVATSRKATISYLQRQLRIGYNSAARLIEQMEQMGLVSAPDHVGRREVLMDEAGNRLG